MTTQAAAGPVNWAGVLVDPQVALWCDHYADRNGVPRNVVRAITLGESGGQAVITGDNGQSAGPLMLDVNYQGAGLTIAQREDPQTAYRVGVPPIAAAWRQTSALAGVQRVERTAALSGHPRDPQQMAPGLEQTLVEGDLARIGSYWTALEQQYPAAGATAQLGGLGVLISGTELNTAVEGALSWLGAHREQAAAFAIVTAVVLWLA